MTLYTDSEGRIKDVDTTEDSSLTAVKIEDEENPFIGWSKAKICCYRITASEIPIYPEPVEPQEEGEEGDEPTPEPEPIGYKTVITMMTPYVDSRLLDHIDKLGKATEAITPYTDTKTAYIEDTEVTFTDVPPGNVSVYMVDTEGMNVPFTVEQSLGQVKVSFEERTSLATITISII